MMSAFIPNGFAATARHFILAMAGFRPNQRASVIDHEIADKERPVHDADVYHPA